MVRIARGGILHPLKMASQFFNSLLGNISSVHIFKRLEFHNVKVTVERRWGKLDKHMLTTTLTVKSKRRQNGGAACVATVK